MLPNLKCRGVVVNDFRVNERPKTRLLCACRRSGGQGCMTPGSVRTGGPVPTPGLLAPYPQAEMTCWSATRLVSDNKAIADFPRTT